jgi:unsaturated rhamnogalacturonyl hydrolase
MLKSKLMQTRKFLLFFVAVTGLTVLVSCKQPVYESTKEEETIQKVKSAMLCMQRHSWEQGVLMQAAIETGDTSNLILMAYESIFRQFPDGRLSMVGSSANVGDPGLNGVGVVEAYRITGDEKFKKAAQLQYDYLKDPKQKNAFGVIYHNNQSKVVFSDNMFMVAPFMAHMGDFDEAMFQIEGIRDILWNKEMKLFHHIRTQETGEYTDSTFWGGGNGWCAAAMTQIIDLLPAERTSDRQKLISYCTELLDGCLEWQLPSGLFYDQITLPNFEESTLPAMLAYSIYTAVRSGWLSTDYLPAADKMRKAVYAKVDTYGFIQDASDAPRFASPGYSPEAQAFFLMMEGAYNKLKSSNQQS